jgi:hypothetical protein
MEFVCPDPTATVRAANMRAVLDAFTLVPSAGQRLIERQRLSVADLLPENYVPVQRFLDMLKEIHTAVGPSVLRTAGTRIVVNADFPPQFETVESVLLALDAIYHLNHRGEVGHYRTSQEKVRGAARTGARGGGVGGSPPIEKDAIVVVCQTPYPRHFERGIVEGICANKVAAGHKYAIEYVDGPPGGDTSCTMTVRRR